MVARRAAPPAAVEDAGEGVATVTAIRSMPKAAVATENPRVRGRVERR